MSHTCSLTDLLAIFTTLDPNSTPIVWLESCLTEGGIRASREVGRVREERGEEGKRKGVSGKGKQDGK